MIMIAIATMGTFAYFSKSFTSDKNTVTAASFEVEAVNADGTVIGDAEFSLAGKLYPGMKTIEAYTFQINKNNTEVPVEYKINVLPSGDLFPEDGTSPIVMTLQRNMSGTWTDNDLQSTFIPEADTESLKILIDWPHGDHDIDFQGMTGNIKLEVVAMQIDDEAVAPNEINGTVVNTVSGEASSLGQQTIIMFDFGEGKPSGGNGGFDFWFSDGDLVKAMINQTVWDVSPPESSRFDGKRLAKNLVDSIGESKEKAWLAFKDAWEVKRDGTKVVFTSKEKRDYENVKISITYTQAAHANIPENQINVQDGMKPYSGASQVITLNIHGTIQRDGNFDVYFTDGVNQSTKTIQFSKADTTAIIAGKIVAAFTDLHGWKVTNATGAAKVIFTAAVPGENKEVEISFSNK